MNARRHRDFRPGFDHLDGRVLLSARPISPAQIRQAYSENYVFSVNGQSYTATGAGQTIGIIVAGLDPYIFNDLVNFDRTYGLAAPPSFQSVYFQGAQYNESADWIEETVLDVEWARAVAPGANILLVQAASPNPGDYVNAINWARYQTGVSVVSMNYGAPESAAYAAYSGVFTTPAGHTGVTFVAASGDSGFFNSNQGTQVGVE
jgi:subtilase family serine protease